MGRAALVLGIISIIISFVPLCGIIAFLPALIGIILAVVDLALKNKKYKSKSVSIAGLILSSLSIVIMLLWFFFLGIAVKSGKIQKKLEDLNNQIQLEIENETNKIDSNSYDF